MPTANKLIALVFLLIFYAGNAQDTIVKKNFQKNMYEFQYLDASGFEGEGWDSIVKKAEAAKASAVGEIHGVEEIPLLLQELTEEVDFDTFVAEIDPLLARIIGEKIKNLSAEELEEWRKVNAGQLSFYSYKRDFDLFQDFVENGLKVIGIDQITALNDIPVYRYLAESTSHPEKKDVFLTMASNAELLFGDLLKDPQKVRPYLMTNQFQADLERLEEMVLSPEESEVISNLKMSRNIYLSKRGHEKRIMLMKNQLMKEYDSSFVDKKVLLRLGANHSLKGESFLDVYDVGNLVHNLAESQFQKSFHLAVFSKAGAAGNPLLNHQDTPIKLPKDLIFLNDITGEDWSYFDLNAIREDLRGQKVEIESSFLGRIIEGYDALIIVPSSIPAKME